MAFTKEEKNKMLEQYENWLAKSQAVFLLEYSKMNMKEIDGLRAKARDAGGEMHVVKNTLFGLASGSAWYGWQAIPGTDHPWLGLRSMTRPRWRKLSPMQPRSEVFKVKGGFLGKQAISPSEVKALADMPPLPVVRAQLLGVLLRAGFQAGSHHQRTRSRSGCCHQGVFRKGRSTCRVS